MPRRKKLTDAEIDSWQSKIMDAVLNKMEGRKSFTSGQIADEVKIPGVLRSEVMRFVECLMEAIAKRGFVMAGPNTATSRKFFDRWQDRIWNAVHLRMQRGQPIQIWEITNGLKPPADELEGVKLMIFDLLTILHKQGELDVYELPRSVN